MTGPEQSTNPPFEDPVRVANRVERLLTQQSELVEELDSLGEKQRALIEAGDAEGLLTLLGERQDLTDRIRGLAQEMEPFRARWDELLASMPDDRRERIRSTVSALAGRIQASAERDERDREALQRRRDVVTDELANVSKARGAVAAYGRARGGPRYQDREG
jgi:vacuolar-type H+-ATPase subunit I/STV1